MAIRQASDDDWPAIWPFFDATVKAEETYAFPMNLTIETARGWWMQQPPAETVVLEEGGVILGSANMGRTAPVTATTSAPRASWWLPMPEAAASAAASVSTSCGGTATAASTASSSTRSSNPTPPRCTSGDRWAFRSSALSLGRSNRRRTATSACT